MRWGAPTGVDGRQGTGAGVVNAGFRIVLLLGPADGLLDLALDLLRLALDLLAGIAGRGARGAAHPAFHLLGCTLELILHALGGHVLVISHLALLFEVQVLPFRMASSGVA